MGKKTNLPPTRFKVRGREPGGYEFLPNLQKQQYREIASRLEKGQIFPTRHEPEIAHGTITPPELPGQWTGTGTPAGSTGPAQASSQPQQQPRTEAGAGRRASGRVRAARGRTQAAPAARTTSPIRRARPRRAEAAAGQKKRPTKRQTRMEAAGARRTRSARDMSPQTGSKAGLRSMSQKRVRARHGEDTVPAARKKAGAFGKTSGGRTSKRGASSSAKKPRVAARRKNTGKGRKAA